MEPKINPDFTFSQYQENADATAQFALEDPLLYCIMGAAGEGGETLEKAKKAARKAGTYDISPYLSEGSARLNLLKELGDQLWYLSQAARLLGSSLEEVAVLNNLKLADRDDRN